LGVALVYEKISRDLGSEFIMAQRWFC